MNIAREVLANAINSTPIPKHTFRSPGYRPNMTFDTERFAKACEARGLDPADALIRLLMGRGQNEMKAKELADVYVKVCEYVYPKQRAVEHSGNVKVGLSDLLAGVEAEWQAQKSKDS